MSFYPRGGYSLYDGWYICAAVLTPFFDPLGTKLDLFGVFFLIHQHKNDLLGTNPHKIRFFWPQNTIFPSIFLGPIFSGPLHTPSNFRTKYPPPPPPGILPHRGWIRLDFAYFKHAFYRRIAGVCFELHFRVTLGQFRSAAASSLHRRLALLATSTRPSFSKNAYSWILFAPMYQKYSLDFVSLIFYSNIQIV